MRIRLEERGRRPPECGGEHHRAGDVAAAPQYDVRPTAAENLQARGRRARCSHESPCEPNPGPPRQTRAAKRVELVTRLRNEARLDVIRRPGEAHPDAALLQRLGDGERRQHVPRRAPGRDHAPELSLLRHDCPRC